MSTTIYDIARVAGVSASTVSRAMRGGKVNAATRASVLEAATRLGYEPNRAARGLTTGQTGNLGILVPDLANPFFASVIKGVAARTRAPEHPLFVSETDEDASREGVTIRSLLRGTDGLLLCSPRTSDEEVRDAVADAPVVVLNRQVPGLPSVTYDVTSGARQAVQHLMALGHRHIAYVAGPAGSWSDQRRSAGAESAREFGVEVTVVPCATPTFASGVLAADLLLNSGATAVVAFNDLMALGVVNRLTARGVRIPEDMSVVGHDDVEMASMSVPALTTVQVPKERIGVVGVEQLLRLLQERALGAAPREGRATDVVLPATLAVRGSTGVAPVR